MQLWRPQQVACFDIAMKADLTALIISFISHRKLAFSEFKKEWAQKKMSNLHHLCPRKVNPNLYLQSLFQNTLDLLHNIPNENAAVALGLDSYDRSISNMIWNIGVFYTLYTLYYMRLNSHTKTRIRVSPEIWLEMLLAFERMSFFGLLTSQATRVFQRLVKDKAFHFAMYTGGPTLHRVYCSLSMVRTLDRLNAVRGHSGSSQS
jgi:hypothetical protein